MNQHVYSEGWGGGVDQKQDSWTGLGWTQVWTSILYFLTVSIYVKQQLENILFFIL